MTKPVPHETSPVPVPHTNGTDVVRQSAPLARRGLDALQKGRGRVVRFPSEPIGTYWLFSGSEDKKPVYCDACGEVYVPPGWGLALIPEGPEAFRHLSSLDPDDVDRLWYTGGSGNSYSPGDKNVRHIRHLSGLRYLYLRGLNLSGRDFSWLRLLCKVEELQLQNDNDFGGPLPGVLVENLSADAPLTRLKLFYVRLGEAHLHRLSQYQQLACLQFEYERGDGSGFAELASLTSLEELTVPTGGRDEDFAVLRAFPRLRSLWLSSTEVTSGVGVHLGHLQSLEVLSLVNAPVTGAVLRELAKLSKLSELDLSFTRVQGELDEIADLPIRSLRLSNLRLTDTDLPPIRRLTGLERLDLGSTQVTDAVGPVLGSLLGLQGLDLRYTGVTDRTLELLGDMPNLLRLNVAGTSVSKRAAQRLCEKIPQLVAQKYSEWEVRGELATDPFHSLG